MEGAKTAVDASRLLERDLRADKLDDIDALFYEIEITRHHYNGSGRTLRTLATSGNVASPLRSER